MSRHVEEDRLWKWFHLLHPLKFSAGYFKEEVLLFTQFYFLTEMCVDSEIKTSSILLQSLPLWSKATFEKLRG